MLGAKSFLKLLSRGEGQNLSTEYLVGNISKLRQSCPKYSLTKSWRPKPEKSFYSSPGKTVRKQEEHNYARRDHLKSERSCENRGKCLSMRVENAHIEFFLKLDRTFTSKSDTTNLNGMKTCELGPFPNLFHYRKSKICKHKLFRTHLSLLLGEWRLFVN